jgi:hypothetical protein
MIIRASLPLLALVPLWLSCLVVNAHSGEPVAGKRSSKADRPPRKVIVGTTVFGPFGKYPGLTQRLAELSGLVDEMAERARKLYPGSGLDLAILPESVATATSGSAHERAIPLFWSNDPATTIGAMIRSIGGEELDRQIERNERLYSAARGGKPVPALKITLRKPEDRVETVVREGGAVVTVTSPSGIGGAVLERTGAAWPEPLEVRLRLHGLESLKVAIGPMRIRGWGSHAGNPHTSVDAFYFQDNGREEDLRLRDPQDRFRMKIQAIDDQGKPAKEVPLQGGHFEFTLPGALLVPRAKTVEIEWVDFHR